MIRLHLYTQIYTCVPYHLIASNDFNEWRDYHCLGYISKRSCACVAMCAKYSSSLFVLLHSNKQQKQHYLRMKTNNNLKYAVNGRLPFIFIAVRWTGRCTSFFFFLGNFWDHRACHEISIYVCVCMTWNRFKRSRNKIESICKRVCVCPIIGCIFAILTLDCDEGNPTIVSSRNIFRVNRFPFFSHFLEFLIIEQSKPKIWIF